MAAGTAPLQAVVHVDLDGLDAVFEAHGWPAPPGPDPVFRTGLAAALELFDRAGVRATLFTIARDLKDPAKRTLLQEAVRRGHEIGSHTVTHRNLRGLGTEDRRTEILESRRMLEGALGTSVRGFRAPGYRVDRECLELLSEAGYRYDASAFPTRSFARRLGVPVDALRTPTPALGGMAIAELPLPDHRPFPFPVNPSYALLFGMRYFRWGVERMWRRRAPFVLLFHLIDFADPVSAELLVGWRSRLFTLSTVAGRTKRRRCDAMLQSLADRYDLTTTGALLASLDGAGSSEARGARG